eukprot:gene9123-10699_t
MSQSNLLRINLNAVNPPPAAVPNVLPVHPNHIVGAPDPHEGAPVEPPIQPNLVAQPIALSIGTSIALENAAAASQVVQAAAQAALQASAQAALQAVQATAQAALQAVQATAQAAQAALQASAQAALQAVQATAQAALQAAQAALQAVQATAQAAAQAALQASVQAAEQAALQAAAQSAHVMTLNGNNQPVIRNLTISDRIRIHQELSHIHTRIFESGLVNQPWLVALFNERVNSYSDTGGFWEIIRGLVIVRHPVAVPVAYGDAAPVPDVFQ